jgi:type III secretory pathway component EscV
MGTLLTRVFPGRSPNRTSHLSQSHSLKKRRILVEVMTWGNAAAFALMLIIMIVGFVVLIPLETVIVEAAVGMNLVIWVCILMMVWLMVRSVYKDDSVALAWLTTHILFLVVLPLTIATTAMNVITVQNTRNIFAGP